MFGQATLKKARALMEILNDFTSTSRTEINKDKSDTFFFNTTIPSQAFLSIIMGFRIGNIPFEILKDPAKSPPNKSGKLEEFASENPRENAKLDFQITEYGRSGHIPKSYAFVNPNLPII